MNAEWPKTSTRPRRQKAVASSRSFLALLITLAAFHSLADEPATPPYSEYGELILAHLNSAPFPHPDRAAGHRYKDEEFSAAEHYSDNTVAIFIPKSFHAAKSIDFVVHFHGWRNNVTNALSRYRLIEQLVESKRNAILVVPEGPRDAPDSFGGKLEDRDGFKVFMNDVMETLRTKSSLTNKARSLGRIILSGHSGGYAVMASILDRGGLTDHVREVWLFDALYGRTDQFLNWLDQSKGRLLNIYTETGGTKSETEHFKNLLQARDITFLSLNEKGLAVEALRSTCPLILFAELPHDEVVSGHSTFRDFLKTSGLAD
jgi:hypothetical protein